MAILSSVEQFLNNCKETITGWFSTWANTNIKGKYLPLTGGTLTGDLTVNQHFDLKGTTTINGVLPSIKILNSNWTKGTTPTTDINTSICCYGTVYDSNYDRTGLFENGYRKGPPEYTFTKMVCWANVEEDSTNAQSSELGVGWKNNNGTWERFTFSPTPPASDNSTQIATTGWVNTRIASIPSVGTYTLPTASSIVKGGVKIGNGLQITNEAINIKLPTSSNLSVDANGLKCTYKYTHHTQDTIAFGPANNATIANGGTFQIPQIAVNGEGHTTSITARTMTLPKYVAGTGITISGNTISSTVANLSIGTATGTGNAITSLSISNNQIVPNLGSKFSLDGHTHSGYAASNHNHDSVYSKTNHNHDSVYAAKSHTHNYAPLASPELTGTPTAPTATAGTNTTQIATTAFVGTAVSNALSSVSVNINLCASTVTKSSGSYYLSGNVGAVVYLSGNDPDFLIFPKGTSWLVVGYVVADGENQETSRISQVVTIASNANTTNRLLRTLLANIPSTMYGYAIRVA